MKKILIILFLFYCFNLKAQIIRNTPFWQLMYHYGPDLVIYGNMEGTYTNGVCANWTFGIGNPSENTTTPYAGHSSQNITNPAANSGYVYIFIHIPINTWYKLSFYAKATKGYGGSIVEAVAGQFDRVYISSTDWTRYTIYFQSTSTAVAPRFFATTNPENDHNGVSFDNVYLYKILNK
jgi:hypothetical protein